MPLKGVSLHSLLNFIYFKCMLILDGYTITTASLDQFELYLAQENIDQLLVLLSSPSFFNEGQWLLSAIASLSEPDIPDSSKERKLYLLKRILRICKLLSQHSESLHFTTAYRSIAQDDLSPIIQNIKDYLYGVTSSISGSNILEYTFSEAEIHQLNFLVLSSV